MIIGMLNVLYNIFKIFVVYLLRLILSIFWIIPVKKNKVVFTSYEGRQYSCNPKYLFEYMINHYGNIFSYIWVINKASILPGEFKKNKTVKFLSFWYFFHILTAEIIIENSAVKCYLPFRKKQVIVNTWHGGGAYKKVSTDALTYQKKMISMKIAKRINAKTIKYVISSCEKFTAVSSKVWAIPDEKFLAIGMPRNDIFFNISDSIKRKVKDFFILEGDEKIILYAPTYRGDYRNADSIDFSLDIERLLQAFTKRFEHNFIFLYRSHIFNKLNLSIINSNIVSATNYPDMQELLLAADIFITDYSSSIWDYSFTFKPCFIYAPDLKQYHKEHGFYTPIEEWPFPLAVNNGQLVDNILNFNEDLYKQAVIKHHADMGSYENGTACEQFCKIVFDRQIYNG